METINILTDKCKIIVFLSAMLLNALVFSYSYFVTHKSECETKTMQYEFAIKTIPAVEVLQWSSDTSWVSNW
jgi:hypothetical protein